MGFDTVSLPVKTTLRQNDDSDSYDELWVSLPVKTTLRQNWRSRGRYLRWSHYQSKRRCAKTPEQCANDYRSLITSQNDAAPKPSWTSCRPSHGLITSQNDAAPKLALAVVGPVAGLITSQNDAAPKPCPLGSGRVSASHYQSKRRCAKTFRLESTDRRRLITSQNDAAPKR